MVTAWRAVAIADLPRPPVWDLRLLWATLALIVIILVGAVVILWLDRWRKRPGTEPLTAKVQLAHFRKLYERGELSQEEYERISALLTRQMRQELEVPGAASDAPAKNEPEPPGASDPGKPPA